MTADDSTSGRAGGGLLVEALRHHGVDVAFGIVSVHNLPLVDVLEHELRWVPMRTEAGAVNAADGYARARDGLGCAVTSTGTGAGNAAGALLEALTAGSSVLHVTGQIDSDYLGHGRGVIHEVPRQPEMLDAVSARSWTLGPDAAGDLAAATAGALRGPPVAGPVSVEWPIDYQYGPQGEWAPVSQAQPTTADTAALDAAAELISAAERPLVWAGGGARWSGPELDRFLSLTGAGLLTSNAGRGVIPETDRRVVGNFGAAPEGAALLAEADLLVSVGTHFRSNETRTYRLGLPDRHVQIDADAAAIGRAYPCTAGVVGDAAVVLGQLSDRLEGSAAVAWGERIAAARDDARQRLRRDIGPYAELCDILRGRFPDTAPMVRDITIPNSAWGNRLLDIHHPTTNIYPRGGGIGQALGMGIGAAIAAEQPTLVLVGDGGLQVQLGELATVVQEQLPIVIVVFDDGGYGVLRNMQDRHLRRRSGVDLHTPDLVGVATAHGMAAVSVGDATSFERAIGDALDARSPTLVRVDCAQLGPMPVPFVPPVHIPGQD